MSRIYCANLNFSSLYEIHAGLCHPGITRTYHFIKMKNLPYSIVKVRKIVNECRICAEIKPRFHKPIESHFIKKEISKICYATLVAQRYAFELRIRHLLLANH